MLLATPKNIEVALNNIISDFVLKITSYVDDAKKENRRFRIVKLPKMFIYAPTSRRLYVGIEFDNTACTFNPRDVETQDFNVNINVYLDKEFAYTFDTSNFDFYCNHFDSAFNCLCTALSFLASKYYFDEALPLDALADANFDIVFDYAEFETIPRFSARHSKISEARRRLNRNNF